MVLLRKKTGFVEIVLCTESVLWASNVSKNALAVCVLSLTTKKGRQLF